MATGTNNPDIDAPRRVFCVVYRVGRIHREGKISKIKKSFYRNIGFWASIGSGVAGGATGGAVVGGPWGALFGAIIGGGAALLGGGPTSDQRADSDHRAGYRYDSVLSKYIDGHARSEFSITEDDTELLRRGGGRDQTEVGNYIRPYFKYYGDIRSDNQVSSIDEVVNKMSIDSLPNPSGGVSYNKGEAIYDQKFVVTKKTRHSRHYLEKHCYSALYAYGGELAKISQVKRINNTDDWGATYTVWFTHHVGWIMHVFWDGETIPIQLRCLVQDDLDSSSDISTVATWAAKTTMALATSGASAASTLALNTASYIPQPGGQNMAIAKTQGEVMDRHLDTSGYTPSERGKKYNEMDLGKDYRESVAQARDDVASVRDQRNQAQFEENQRVSNENATLRAAHRAEIAQSINQRRSMNLGGRAFAGLTRIFSGGVAGYSSSMGEFLANKAPFPLLEVLVRTGRHHDDLWRKGMNWKIFNWYFPFGDDSELCMTKGIGWNQGLGKDVFADVHGWVRLSDQMDILETMTNPMIDFWKSSDIFVYQKCCGQPTPHNNYAHDPTCPRPRWKEDGSSFYQGFQFDLKIPLINRPAENHNFLLTEQDEIYTEDVTARSNALLYAFFWCGDETHDWNFISQGGFQTELECTWKPAKNQGIGYGFLSEGDPSGYNKWKGRKYTQIRFGQTVAGEEYIFGKGKGYRYLCWGYPLETPEEEKYFDRGSDDGWWMLKVDEAGKTLELFGIVGNRDKIKSTKFSIDIDPMNLGTSIPLKGFSGMETFGANVPDSFGGGGGMKEGLGDYVPHMGEPDPIGGLVLPTVNQLNVGLGVPDDIKDSMMNMEKYDVRVKLPEILEPPVVVSVTEGLGEGLGEGEKQRILHTEGIGEKTPGEKEGAKESEKKSEKLAEK